MASPVPPRVTHLEVKIAGLDPRHDGARIAQLSDIHVGNLTPRAHIRAAIDAANAADPTREPDGRPAALVYGERMSEELARRAPDASEHLRIAARGQHVERWKIARESYPEGRAGYLAWRTDAARAHAGRVAGIMAGAGYPEADRERVAGLLRKEGLKRDPEVQALEDVVCFVFLRWYFADFAASHGELDIQRIVEKTARKMSAVARAAVAAEFALPEPLARAFAPQGFGAGSG